MILPEHTEALRKDLSATPCVDRVFVGRAETFFISGELPDSAPPDAVFQQLNLQRQKANLPDLTFSLTVVRTLPGPNGGTYFEAYARKPREF